MDKNLETFINFIKSRDLDYLTEPWVLYMLNMLREANKLGININPEYVEGMGQNNFVPHTPNLVPSLGLKITKVTH